MGAVCTKAGREEAAFLKAAKDGDCQEVQRAILRHVDWTYKTQTWNGQTVFHLAARHGRLDVLDTVVEAVRFNPAGPAVWEKLLRLGRSTDAILRSLVCMRDTRCQTALHLACIYGHADVAEQLLRLGATPWCWDDIGGRTPLHYAASMGHVDVIRAVLSHNCPQPGGTEPGDSLRPPNSGRTRLVDVSNDAGYTPLHYAVWAGNTAAIRALTSFDASLSARNVASGNDWIVSCAKCTPLHLAAHKGSVEIVKMLLSAYVQGLAPTTAAGTVNPSDRRRRDPRRHVNANRQLPYHMAIARGFTELAEVLHPDVPLSFILTPADLEATQRLYGPPRLAVLAAKALQAKLVAEIEASMAAVKATAARSGSVAIAGATRTRSGSLAALSGAVAAAAVAAGPSAATAQQVLAAAAAKLRERSIDAGSGTATPGAAVDSPAAAGGVRPPSRNAAAAAAAAAALLLPSGLQAQSGEALRMRSTRPSLDSAAAAVVAAAAVAAAAAGKTASVTGPSGVSAAAKTPSVTGVNGGSVTAGAASTGAAAAAAAATAAAPAGASAPARGTVVPPRMALPAAPVSHGSSGGSDHEALAVEPLQDVPVARSVPARQASLPVPPAPISPFLPTSPTAGAAGAAAGAPTHTFNQAASAFAMFAAEPFDEDFAVRAGQQLHLDGTASVNLATLAHSRAMNGGGGGGAGAAAGEGEGVGGGRMLELTGNNSVSLAALARSHVRDAVTAGMEGRGGDGKAAAGAGAAGGNNRAAANRMNSLRSILTLRRLRATTQNGATTSNGATTNGVTTTTNNNNPQQLQRRELLLAEQLGMELDDNDDLDDILTAMQPPEEADRQAASAGAPVARAAEDMAGSPAAATLAAAVAAAASASASTPAGAAPATPRSRGGTLAFWRRPTSSTGISRASLDHQRALLAGAGGTLPTRPGRTSSGGFRDRAPRTSLGGIRTGRTSSGGIRDVRTTTSNDASPRAGTPLAASAGSASMTPHAAASTGRARRFLSPFAAAAAALSAGPASSAPPSPSPAQTGNDLPRPSMHAPRASPLAAPVITRASVDVPQSGHPDNAELQTPAAADASLPAGSATTTAPNDDDSTSIPDVDIDRSTRLLGRSSITLAVLARNPAAAAPPPETSEPQVDRAVLAMLAGLVEAPHQVLRRYRLLQLTHGLDLHDLLRDHSEAAAATAAAAASSTLGAPTALATGMAAAGGATAAAMVASGASTVTAAAGGLPGDAPAAAKVALVSALARTASDAKSALPSSPAAAEGAAAAAGASGAAGAAGTGPASGIMRRSAKLPEPTVPALSLGRSGAAGFLDDSIVAAAVAAGAASPGPAAAAAAATSSPGPCTTSGRGVGNRLSLELHGGGKADIAAGGPGHTVSSLARASAGVSPFAAAAMVAAGAVGSGSAGVASANAANASLAGQLLRTLSSQAPSESGDGVCGVCFDLPDYLTISTCGHRLCADCSRELCKLNAFKPALCPFCRGFIGGFKYERR